MSWITSLEKFDAAHEAAWEALNNDDYAEARRQLAIMEANASPGDETSQNAIKAVQDALTR